MIRVLGKSLILLLLTSGVFVGCASQSTSGSSESDRLHRDKVIGAIDRADTYPASRGLSNSNR